MTTTGQTIGTATANGGVGGIGGAGGDGIDGTDGGAGGPPTSSPPALSPAGRNARHARLTVAAMDTATTTRSKRPGRGCRLRSCPALVLPTTGA